MKIPNGDAAPSSNSGTTITVFYRRASWNVMNEWLAQQLAECGELVSVRVHMDLNTGSSRECGYVTFAATQAVKAAHVPNGKEKDCHAVNVNNSKRSTMTPCAKSALSCLTTHRTQPPSLSSRAKPASTLPRTPCSKSSQGTPAGAA